MSTRKQQIEYIIDQIRYLDIAQKETVGCILSGELPKKDFIRKDDPPTTCVYFEKMSDTLVERVYNAVRSMITKDSS
jgi:hypothetical protein